MACKIHIFRQRRKVIPSIVLPSHFLVATWLVTFLSRFRSSLNPFSTQVYPLFSPFLLILPLFLFRYIKHCQCQLHKRFVNTKPKKLKNWTSYDEMIPGTIFVIPSKNPACKRSGCIKEKLHLGRWSKKFNIYSPSSHTSTEMEANME